MNETLSYYNTNTSSFVESTLSVKMTDAWKRFTSKLAPSSLILDFGCGSGRDTKYFLEHGFKVEAMDGSEELCKLASAYTGIQVKHMFFQDLCEVDKYNAIWACSSILHLTYADLVDVMKKMEIALKENGLIYTSFKYGNFEGVRNGRYFINMTEERIRKLLQSVDGIEIEEMWITSDVRPGRGEEKWLNLFLRKK